MDIPPATLSLKMVRVHESDLRDRWTRDFPTALKTLDGGRLGVAAQSLGDRPVLSGRVHPLCKGSASSSAALTKFQAISFMIVDMATEIEAAREMITALPWLRTRGRRDAP